MDYQKILIGVLGKTLKMPDGEISELLKDGENALSESEIISKILDKDKDKVKNVRDESFQDGIKKAKKEILSEFETDLKTEFEIESDKVGKDLIKEIVDKKSAVSGEGKKGEITEDDIKKSKPYQDLITQKKTDEKTLKEKYEGEIKTIKDEITQKETFSVIGGNALTILKGMNPIVSKNTEIAKNLEDIFVRDLTSNHKFQIQDGRTLVLDQDGKIKTDAHGNQIEFEDLVKANASKFYEFSKNNGGGNTGDDPEKKVEGGVYPTGINKPKTLEELTKILEDESIPLADRVVVSETYNKEAKGIV